MASIKPVVRLLGGVALSVALSLHHRPAFGQAAAENTDTTPPAADGQTQTEKVDVSTIVVSGTRITSSGFTAPTPTTVLNSEALLKSAEPNMFTSISQLPSLQGSTGTTVGTNSTSSGTQGLSSFSLRGLGTIRSLTLLDNQRVVGANVTGVPDISMFPQLLIKRVDVVTGGASASYGSDAVGGVVNFITDKRFEGVKAEATGGITTYGDDGQFLLGVAAGHSLFDDKLHLEGSVEYDHENGVPAGDFGEGGPNGRSWFRATTLLNTGVLNNGKPQYVYSNDAQSYQYAKYGLITNGPLLGTAFNAAGQPVPFRYGVGPSGLPVSNPTSATNGCYVGFCSGGDNSGDVGIGSSLQSSIHRIVGFGRLGYSIDENNEVYATVNVAQVKTTNQPNPGSAKSGITIQCSNPFVPASIQADCANAGINNFQYGLDNAMLPNPDVEPTRTQERFVVGAEGQVRLANTDWHYDTYYEHGLNVTDIHVYNMPLNPRYNQAIQAISSNGQIVCQNAQAVGCVPINVFGNVAPSAAALAYIEPGNGPFQHTVQTENAASLAINGEPFSDWAGPVSVAFGGEYRREAYQVTADPYGNGVSANSPYSSAYPADPILSTAGANWYAGNYHDGSGRYHVGEAFLETNVPLFDNDTFGKANFNPAGRWTDYSTSGVVYTWKLGGSWVMPYKPLRLRAVFSRDVRAPNLSELYAAPVSVTVPGFTDPFHNTALTILQNTIGNSALQPEKANNLEVGLSLVHPEFLEGFSASIDYYRIRVNGIISSLTAQQEVNFCYAGIQQYCNNSVFNLNPGNGAPAYVNVQSFNLASVHTNGFDLEGSYQFSLDKVHLPGFFTVRALATHTINFLVNTGVPGAAVIQDAGVNVSNPPYGSTPYWKLYGTQSWDFRNVGVDITERWFSDGVFGHQYTVCQTNCPVSTVNNPTINYNTMKGAFYLDIGGRYTVTDKLQAFVKVDNLFNKDPVAAPQTNTGIDINPALYDILGRTYRFGVRYNF